MTGYGKCLRADDGRRIEVEVRSVNHRFFKTQIRLPRELQPHETELEGLLRRGIRRGAVTLSVRLEEQRLEASHTIDRVQARGLHEDARALAGALGLSETPSLDTILSLPGVVVPVEGDEEVSAASLSEVREAVAKAVDALVAMREREGATLKEELIVIKQRIVEAVSRVRERAPELVAEYRDRLKKRLNQLLADCSDKVAVGDADVLREVALFADRSDVSEEIQRLQSHLGQFDAILGDAEAGRKLDFLLQEMLREANTIASKASDSEVARLVIEVKTDLERLREQAQNIE